MVARIRKTNASGAWLIAVDCALNHFGEDHGLLILLLAQKSLLMQAFLRFLNVFSNTTAYMKPLLHVKSILIRLH